MIDIKKLSQDEGKLERFQREQIIFSDGDRSNNKMYIIVDGCVDVFKNYNQPGEICIGALAPGSFFGEMSLFLEKGRTATIVAREDATLYVLDRAGIYEFLRMQPEFTFLFLQTLCKRLDNVNVNVADLSQDKSALETTVNIDALTQVYNRRYFMNNAGAKITAALKKKRFSYIAMFDLDFFKKVNDTYGHQAGDSVLVSFAALVDGSIRSDDVFARYGGEEFILLISCATPDDAVALLERIRIKTANTPVEFEEFQIPVTTSIGIAECKSSEDIESTIALADQALYKAKADGRNRTLLHNW